MGMSSPLLLQLMQYFAVIEMKMMQMFCIFIDKTETDTNKMNKKDRNEIRKYF